MEKLVGRIENCQIWCELAGCGVEGREEVAQLIVLEALIESQEV